MTREQMIDLAVRLAITPKYMCEMAHDIRGALEGHWELDLVERTYAGKISDIRHELDCIAHDSAHA